MDSSICLFQESVREGQHDGNSAEIFENWLSKQMIVARYEHSPPDELEDFVCIWEVFCPFFFGGGGSMLILVILILYEMFSLLEQYFSPSNQIEEEFTAYLHTYTEMLHKVDGIGDTIEVNYLFIHSPIKKILSSEEMKK